MGSPDIGDGSAYDPITGRRRTHATPTPPGAAPDAASGPKAPPRMPAPADDARPMVVGGAFVKFDRPAPAEVCAFCGITTTDAEPSDGTKYVCRDTQPCIDRARKACGLPPKPAHAPDAGAAEDHPTAASFAARRDHGAEGSDRAVVEALTALRDRFAALITRNPDFGATDWALVEQAAAALLRECAKRDREEHCRGASGPSDARAHLKWAKELVRSLSDRDGAVLSLDADEWEDIKAFLALPLPRDASGEMREACADLADDMVQAECDRLLAEAQLLHKNRHWNDDDPGRNSRVSQKAVEGLCGKIGAAIRALPIPGDDAVEEASRGREAPSPVGGHLRPCAECPCGPCPNAGCPEECPDGFSPDATPPATAIDAIAAMREACARYAEGCDKSTHPAAVADGIRALSLPGDDAVGDAERAVVDTAVSFFALLDTMSMLEALRRKEWVDFGACVTMLRRAKGGA